MTVSSCVVDIGETIFSSGQSYVALSRVQSLEGLHILNFNPRSIKANGKSIIEYNRLRAKFHPELGSIQIHKVNNRKTTDKNIYLKRRSHGIIEPSVQPVKNNRDKNQAVIIERIRGFVNNGASCYANASIQCLLNIKWVESSILISRDSVLKKLVIDYIDPNISGNLNLDTLRSKYYPDLCIQQDASEFLRYLLTDVENSLLKNLCSFDRVIYNKCPMCKHENSQIEQDTMYSLFIPNYNTSMQTLLEFNFKSDWSILTGSSCSNCDSTLTTKTVEQNFGQVIIVVLQLINDNQQKITNFKLSNVAHKEIKIQGRKYTFTGAVFHLGESFTAGHYTAIVQNDKNLFRIDDNSIQKCRWPNNSKDVYILFYERV